MNNLILRITILVALLFLLASLLAMPAANAGPIEQPVMETPSLASPWPQSSANKVFPSGGPSGGTPTPDNKPVEDPGGAGGGGCTYCSDNRCGCAKPTAGCTLSATCTCNATTCTVTCSYLCE